MVNIELLDTQQHTIRGQLILHVTKTVTVDKYLICFEKNSLSINVPNKKTIMSKDHKIDFEGQLVPAERLLNYSSEVLYNVLLQDYTVNQCKWYDL